MAIEQLPAFQPSEDLLAHGLTRHAPSKKNRPEKWDPIPFHDDAGSQRATQSISLLDPKRVKHIERQPSLDPSTKPQWKSQKELLVSEKTIDKAKDPLKLLKDYEDIIEHHVALRTALFFQQAIVCYNTPFHYEVATEGQFYKAPALKLKEGTKLEDGSMVPSAKQNLKTASLSYQAAHSGTLPGLLACWRTDYKADKAGIPYFRYLKGSHVEICNNSTNGMPSFVNKMDTLIDGQSRSKKELRGVAIKLLNKVAKGRLTPTDATRQFLDQLKGKLLTRPQSSKTMTLEKKRVIELYLEKVEDMIQQASIPDDAKGVSPFFDRQLNVDLSQEKSDDIPFMRKTIYKKKCKIIRQSQITETKVHEAIEQAFPNRDAEGKNQIRLCLVLQSKSPELQKILQKLFCLSADTIRSDRRLTQSLNAHYQENKTAYDNLLRDFREIVRTFQNKEKKFQAKLLRKFREDLRGWTQKTLSAKIKEVIEKKTKKLEQKNVTTRAKVHLRKRKIRELETMPTSRSTISRWENTRLHVNKELKTPDNQRFKSLTFQHAKIISKALGIQPAHFFCSFAFSREP